MQLKKNDPATCYIGFYVGQKYCEKKKGHKPQFSSGNLFQLFTITIKFWTDGIFIYEFNHG